MTPHLTPEQMDGFRRLSLPPASLEAVALHLDECRVCREATLGRTSISRAAAAFLDEAVHGEHPEIDELIAFQDGALSKERQEIIEAHVEDCRRCQEDLDDMAIAARSVPRARLIAAAAAVACTIGAAIWWMLQPEHVQRVEVRKVAPVHTVVARSEWDELLGTVREARSVAPPPILTELAVLQRDVKVDVLRGTRAPADSIDLSPAGTVVVTQTPLFTWSKGGHERFVVTVACGEVIIRSPATQNGQWRPVEALPRGKTCRWQLERTSDHSVLPRLPLRAPAFRVLDAGSLAEIQRAESMQPRNEFLIAVLYARAGVRSDAEQHLRAYLAVHKDDRAAEDVLRSIQAW